MYVGLTHTVRVALSVMGLIRTREYHLNVQTLTLHHETCIVLL